MCSPAGAIASFHPPRYLWVDLTDVWGSLISYISRQSIILSVFKVVKVRGDPTVLKYCSALHFRRWGFVLSLLSPVLRSLNLLFCCRKLSTCVCLPYIYVFVSYFLQNQLPYGGLIIVEKYLFYYFKKKKLFLPHNIKTSLHFLRPGVLSRVKVKLVFFFYRSWQVWNYNG